MKGISFNKKDKTLVIDFDDMRNFTKFISHSSIEEEQNFIEKKFNKSINDLTQENHEIKNLVIKGHDPFELLDLIPSNLITNLTSLDVKADSDFLNKTFFENLLQNDNLSSLFVNQTSLNKKDSNALIQYFRDTKNLKNFTYLSKNDPTNEQICEALKVNTSIQSLDVSGNKPKHTIKILKSIQNHTSLKALNISESWSDNTLKFASDGTDNGNEIGELIATIITNNPSLEKVDASRCDIGNSGGKAIAQALHNNPSIKYLNLEANCMTKPAIDVFNKNLSDDIVLEFLNLTENKSDQHSIIKATDSHDSNYLNSDYEVPSIGESIESQNVT